MWTVIFSDYDDYGVFPLGVKEISYGNYKTKEEAIKAALVRVDESIKDLEDCREKILKGN